MDDIIGILFMLILIGALVFALRDTSKLATRQQQQPKRPPTNAFGEQALVGIALVGGVFVLLLPGWGVILTVWLFLVSVPGIGIQFIPPFRWPKEAKTMAGTLWNIAVWCFFTLFVAGIAFLLGGLLNGFIKSIGLVNPPDGEIESSSLKNIR
jgi:cbb3-type cytochrome oxidase subunit 3